MELEWSKNQKQKL